MPDTPPVPGPPVPGPVPNPPASGAQVPSGAPGPTGEPHVDEALAALDALDPQALGEHVETYTRVHRLLSDALSSLDGV